VFCRSLLVLLLFIVLSVYLLFSAFDYPYWYLQPFLRLTFGIFNPFLDYPYWYLQPFLRLTLWYLQTFLRLTLWYLQPFLRLTLWYLQTFLRLTLWYLQTFLNNSTILNKTNNQMSHQIVEQKQRPWHVSMEIHWGQPLNTLFYIQMEQALEKTNFHDFFLLKECSFMKSVHNYLLSIFIYKIKCPSK
jgi:hypothetical protein